MRNPECICYNCMAELHAPGEVCPKCGWDNARRESGPGYLAACVLRGQYFIGRPLGRGGFGVTYLGFDLNLNRPVAIKEYFPPVLAARSSDHITVIPFSDSQEQFEKGRKRARDEGALTARLNDVPNAVQVYNAFEENGTVYIVMQFIAGTTLTKLVRAEDRIPWGRAYDLIRPIMEALEAIHAQGVIHRDVSPDNIMLRENSAKTVLLDFGAARSYVQDLHGMTAMLCQGYAPLEQYSSTSKQDGRTDEYALCATLYFLLTGCMPPAADQIFYGSAQLIRPRSLGADMPAAAEAALMKGMSSKMEDRYPSISALREAFDAAESFEEDHPVPQKERRRSWKAPLAAALGVILVAIGVLVALKLTGDKPAAPDSGEAPAATFETEPVANETVEETAGIPQEEATAEAPAEVPAEVPAVTSDRDGVTVVPYGAACQLLTEVTAYGAACDDPSDTPCETLSFTLRVLDHREPDYFSRTYGAKYKLQGDEAVVPFEITLNGYTGSRKIVPQDALPFAFADGSFSTVTEGYQLMDAEISGSTDVAAAPGVAATLYKRYSFSEETAGVAYLSVTAHLDGGEMVYMLELPPVDSGAADRGEPASTGEASESEEVLTIGSTGDEVAKLQGALIKLGLLAGTPDGKYGTYTADAVRTMQQRYGMQPTGNADRAFLDRLYADAGMAG